MLTCIALAGQQNKQKATEKRRMKKNIVLYASCLLAAVALMTGTTSEAQLTAPDLTALSNGALSSLATGTVNGVNFGITAGVVITGLAVIIGVVLFARKKIRGA